MNCHAMNNFYILICGMLINFFFLVFVQSMEIRVLYANRIFIGFKSNNIKIKTSYIIYKFNYVCNEVHYQWKCINFRA